MRDVLKREELERELIKLGLGSILGMSEYYYPYDSWIKKRQWEKKVQDFINKMKLINDPRVIFKRR